MLGLIDGERTLSFSGQCGVRVCNVDDKNLFSKNLPPKQNKGEHSEENPIYIAQAAIELASPENYPPLGPLVTFTNQYISLEFGLTWVLCYL